MGWAPRFLTTVPFLAAAPTTGTLRRRRGWYDSSPSPPWGAGLRVTFIGGIFAVQVSMRHRRFVRAPVDSLKLWGSRSCRLRSVRKQNVRPASGGGTSHRAATTAVYPLEPRSCLPRSAANRRGTTRGLCENIRITINSHDPK